MNLTEEFLKLLKRRDWPYNHNADLHIFYNLFSIINISNPKFLEEMIELYKEYTDDWFYFFHKQFRQVDVIDNGRISAVNPVITEEELNEKIKLGRELQILRKEHDKKYPELAKQYDDGTLKYSEWSHRWQTDIPYYKERLLRLRELNTKNSHYTLDTENNISGHLDSIIWCTIANDNGDFYEFVKKFMELNTKTEEVES